MRSAALSDVRGHWTESNFSSERGFDVTGNHGNQGVAYSITQSVIRLHQGQGRLV